MNLPEELQFDILKRIGTSTLFLVSKEIKEVIEKNATALVDYRCETTTIIAVPRFKNLTRLEIPNSIITNLDILATCTQLRELHIGSTLVSDLSPLRHLPLLEKLNVENTHVEDISPLSSCTAMREINTMSCLVDISPLSYMHNLQNVVISTNMAHTLAPVAANCKELSVDVCNDECLCTLTRLRSLEKFCISKSQVKSLEPLITTLRTLSIVSVDLQDVSHLSKFQLLTDLTLKYCRQIDLPPIPSLTKLTMVDFKGDTSNMVMMSNLKSLCINSMDVYLSSSLCSLTELNISYTVVVRSDQLSHLTNLRRLVARKMRGPALEVPPNVDVIK